MNYALIVMETNPLHYGHHYLIQRAKEDGYGIVVLMSASFTQRGLPVVTDKFSRAQDLIAAGADLVVTLPIQIATSYGELFSYGAMAIAERIGEIRAVYCGTEWGNVDAFDAILSYESSSSFQNRLKAELDRGESYSGAYLEALVEKDASWQSLFQSNALLAYGYYKALKSLNSTIRFVPIPRTKDSRIAGISASTIRKLYATDPDSCRHYAFKTPPQYDEKVLYERLYRLYRHLLLEGSLDLSDYDGYENGIDRRIERYLKSESSFEEFLESAKTKRYSKWRLSRILLHRLLRLTAKDIERSVERQRIFQVLAHNESGNQFLSLIKSRPVTLLTNFKHIKKYTPEDRAFLESERRATDLWNVLTAGRFGHDFYGR